MTRRDFIGAGAAFAALAGRGLAAAQGVGLATGTRRLRIGIVSDIHVTSEEVAERFGISRNLVSQIKVRMERSILAVLAEMGVEP